MSTISTRHSILPFISGSSSALSGQRMSKIGYKTEKKTGKQRFPSVCVSVPVILTEEITGSLTALMPHIRAMIEDTQDKVVRSLYESSEGALSSVSDSEISVQACISFLEMESDSNRLTRETVINWFNSTLADNLTVYIAEKLNFNDPDDSQMKIISQHVSGYQEVLASLSGGATILATPQINGCKKALELVADSTDSMAARLMKRLVGMEKPPEKLKELLEL